MVYDIFTEQILYGLNQVYDLLKVVSGGLAGLYLVTIVMRWYEMRKMKRIMRHVEHHLKTQQRDIEQIKHMLSRRPK